VTEDTAAEAALDTGAERAKVGPYLAAALGDPAWAECTVSLISGGKSNLTYLVTGPPGQVVLRRPPLGHVLPTAHDMLREARVMRALAGTPVPVPAVLAVCEGPLVLGAPFYVMSRVDGLVCRDHFPPGYADTPAERGRIAAGLIRTLADLHAVDRDAVGLGDFGRPEGYLARQVRRWSVQWEATRTHSVPDLDDLAARLAAQIPDSGPATIVHGDFRLDNTMLDPREPGRILAVLDWEMSTVGDPLADLGLMLVYWSEPGEEDRPGAVASVTHLEGFPRRAEVAASYAQLTGRSIELLPWYVAFGCFKLAVVVQGIAARVAGGAMLGTGFDADDGLVAHLVGRGHAALG
jgi:aminoglycoside phosphotransferase (APT) family kinase protein